MSIAVRTLEAGIEFGVRVAPGARKARVAGAHGERLKASVSAPAERGRANAALVRLLAEQLGVARRDLAIVAGATSRDKTIRVQGEPGLLAARVRRLAEAAGDRAGGSRA